MHDHRDPDVFAEPTERVGGVWITWFTTAWFGLWMAQLTPQQFLLPAQITAVLPGGSWVDDVVAFGVISGAAGLTTVVAYPLAGLVSDRTTSRFGRRRPWIAIGSVVFAAGLVALGFSETPVLIGAAWCLATVGACTMLSALAAMISDRVPVGQRGLVSALSSAPQAVGIIVGLVLVTVVFTAPVVGYAVLAGVVLLACVPLLVVSGDAPLTDRQSARVRRDQRARGPLSRYDANFWWVLATRLLVNTAAGLGTSLLLYYLMFGLGRPAPEEDLLTLTLVFLVVVVASALVTGPLSDRLGTRIPFSVVGALSMAAGAALPVFAPSIETAALTAALTGLGYGIYQAVEQAIATEILRDPESRGRDLGILNTAAFIPQSFAALAGSLVVTLTGGFTALFAAAACCALVGAVTITRVRRRLPDGDVRKPSGPRPALGA